MRSNGTEHCVFQLGFLGYREPVVETPSGHEIQNEDLCVTMTSPT